MWTTPLSPQLASGTLLALAIEGDPEARRSLIESLSPVVWSICRQLDPDPEDACQEIWEKVLRALPRFDPAGPASVKTWVARITHRHLVDRHRRRKVRGIAVDPDDELSVSVTPRPELGRLEGALAQLPDVHRRVVILHHVHGVALEDIAEEEGVPVGTIKSRLHRARARLMEILGGP
ncbi:MAG: RNA polymerase sigma factor [Pseudomonadota bacterium]|nr:RNA polymerase sigma factor [Pseudomonadota bacterium]